MQSKIAHARFTLRSVLKHDLPASVSVFFVALPLCLGVSLASNAPLYSGLLSGIIGGILVPFISKSALSVSGPAAGLTAICAAAIAATGDIQTFFLSVMLAGALQTLLGVFRLGGFTHFIPSAVIKGMLSAIGIMLISKQVPLLIGYDEPDFWTNAFFNVFTFDHAFDNILSVINHTSAGAIIIAAICVGIIIVWNKLSKKPSSVPQAFIIVIIGSSVAAIFKAYMPTLALHDGQFVRIPSHAISQITIPDLQLLFSDSVIWRNAVIICFVATLETLLSITAIDKLDNKNRITPQNRELVAQGFANFISGMVGGLPITAVIVRSSANVQAGAQSKWSAVLHGVWLLIAILFGVYLLDFIPYCVLAVILIQTGYSLAKPHIFKSVYRQGNEQFMPFIVTFFAILFTDLLIGVGIGISYAIYFLIKHTYRAGYSLQVIHHGHTTVYKIELALNVSFMNKKRILDLLESIPSYSEVEINGVDSVYIDRDVLEVIQEYRSKAKSRHIQLTTFGIAEVETLVAH